MEIETAKICTPSGVRIRPEVTTLPNACSQCKFDRISVQASAIELSVVPGKDFEEFPVMAAVCPSCGHMDFYLATPAQFKQWHDLQRN